MVPIEMNSGGKLRMKNGASPKLLSGCILCCVILLLGSSRLALAGEETDVVGRVHRSMVAVRVLRPQSETDKKKAEWSVNTGFLLGGKGEVVTSLITVSGAEKIRVIKLDGHQFQAQLKAYHQPAGIALLKTKIRKEGFNLATEAPGSGERVMVATAHAPESHPPRLTLRSTVVTSNGASVRCHGVTHQRLIAVQTKCPMGAASAPLLTRTGEVAGVVLGAMHREDGPESIYVFPVERLRTAVSQLQNAQNVPVGWLGMAISGTEENRGILVRRVLTKSPAHKAGVRPGDVITSVRGQKMADPLELTSRIADIDPGSRLPLRVQRDGEMRKTTIEVGHRPLRICRIRGDDAQTGKSKPFTSSCRAGEVAQMRRELLRLRRRVKQLQKRLRKVDKADGGTGK